MSPKQIITRRRMKLPSYPPGSYVYVVPEKTSNSIDKMRSFAALCLRPTNEGGGHFVYNIATMERYSVGRIIGINKKPIQMTDNVIDTINKQAKEEIKEIEYADIILETKLNDYQGNHDSDSDSRFDYDDKYYETSDDSTVKGDNDLDDNYDDKTDQHDDDHDDPSQEEEGQQQHFNVQVNNNAPSDGEEGVRGINLMMTPRSIMINRNNMLWLRIILQLMNPKIRNMI